jgi:hypothetical protein
MNLEWSLDLRGMKLGDENAARLAAGLQKGLLKAGAIVRGKLKEATISGPVYARTGTLQRSWTVTETKDLGGGAYSVAVVSNDSKKGGRRVAYADILDRGGVIKPDGHKYLAIPIFESVTARGVTRVGFEGPRQAAATLGRELQFVKKAFSSKAYMGVAGKDGKFHAYFALRESVRIKPTGYKDAAVERATGPATAAITGEIDKAVRELK